MNVPTPQPDLETAWHEGRLRNAKICLCPGCYWDHAPSSELCDRCEYQLCTGEVSRHG